MASRGWRCVLISGASGLLGRALTQSLRSDGHETVVAGAASSRRRPRCNGIRGSRSIRRSLRAPMRSSIWRGRTSPDSGRRSSSRKCWRAALRNANARDRRCGKLPANGPAEGVRFGLRSRVLRKPRRRNSDRGKRSRKRTSWPRFASSGRRRRLRRAKRACAS